MSSKKPPSILRIYGLSTIVSLALVAFVGFQEGLAALLLVLILVGLEITFSFDNAVVNTRILQKMSPGWQQAFLTVGILIAVVGVRVVLPLLIVAGAAGISMGEVVNLALNNPEKYGEELEHAHPMIASFGGIFLLMIALDFFFARRKTKWLKNIENVLQKAGKLESISVIVALVALFISSKLVHGEEQLQVMTWGLIGLLTYLAINAFDTLLEKSGIESNLQKNTQATFRAGLVGFLYLNVIDASFSLDGVIGAFAITNEILLIGVGLGVGALYVRVITVHMLRHKVLDQYKYMEHGAHYAIWILALIMLASLKFHIPEAVAGLGGVVVIIAAIVWSRVEPHKAKRVASKS
jgi:uncharacterized protein